MNKEKRILIQDFKASKSFGDFRSSLRARTHISNKSTSTRQKVFSKTLRNNYIEKLYSKFKFIFTWRRIFLIDYLKKADILDNENYKMFEELQELNFLHIARSSQLVNKWSISIVDHSEERNKSSQLIYPPSLEGGIVDLLTSRIDCLCEILRSSQLRGLTK